MHHHKDVHINQIIQQINNPNNLINNLIIFINKIKNNLNLQINKNLKSKV